MNKHQHNFAVYILQVHGATAVLGPVGAEVSRNLLNGANGSRKQHGP